MVSDRPRPPQFSTGLQLKLSTGGGGLYEAHAHCMMRRSLKLSLWHLTSEYDSSLQSAPGRSDNENAVFSAENVFGKHLFQKKVGGKERKN